MRLRESHARLEPYVTFNPARAAIFQLVPVLLERFFHRDGNPKLHLPSDEGPIKALRRDADNRVYYAVEPLRFSNDFGIAVEASLPELIADDRYRVCVAPHIFARLESAPPNGMNSDGVKIICRYDTAGCALGPVADAESSSHNLADNK